MGLEGVGAAEVAVNGGDSGGVMRNKKMKW